MSDAKRVLPADVYDALELSALAFGGIGAGEYGVGLRSGPSYPVLTGEALPVCATGHAIWCDIEGAYTILGNFTIRDSDNAVRRINRRRHRAPNTRVPFKAWCRALNVVRGES